MDNIIQFNTDTQVQMKKPTMRKVVTNGPPEMAFDAIANKHVYAVQVISGDAPIVIGGCFRVLELARSAVENIIKRDEATVIKKKVDEADDKSFYREVTLTNKAIYILYRLTIIE